MSAASDRLLVVGSVAFDTVETRAGRAEEVLGGAAVYIALAASHFCPVALVGVVGENDFPSEHVDLLTSRGVDISGLEYRPGRTFRWEGVYAEDFSSRTTVRTELGVFGAFSPELSREHRACSTVVLGNIHPEIQLRVRHQLPPDAFVILDTMNLWIETEKEALDAVVGQCSLLIINDEEAWQYTGERQVRRAAARLLERGPRFVVIKRGEHGAYLFGRDFVFFCPAVPLEEVVDPTGAGDSFAGALAGFVTASGSVDAVAVKRAMAYATAVASAACEDFGTAGVAALTRAAVEERRRALLDMIAVPD